ncbi:MAG: ABC-ATPase domain-containing protein, partial [Myxococcales bacterium]|nr:ABC-ATPase domain-containing protein [Myxococcales bacterium]
IDHVQGDPFAAPSRIRVVVPRASARIPEGLLDGVTRRLAVADHMARAFDRACHRVAQRRGSGKSGMIRIDAPGQEVLERTACRVDEAGVELRVSVGLPAAGRRVLGRQAAALLLDDLPDATELSAFFDNLDAERVWAEARALEDQRALRHALARHDLVAFVADGSILPRRSGIDPRPMPSDEAVPFVSPPERRVELDTPHAGRVSGLGIPRGVTLIVGGGYHGKSTLLSAIELGVYDHRLGDGRERVVSDPSAAKIRAEDGRRVAKVDISAFIAELPGGRATTAFTSDDASGSTSQAANVVEALEAGARLLLVDEDTAATNFMIRDHRMQRLIAKDREPITPFVDRVRQLYEQEGVSTVLVVGGSGDYFDVADTVIAMHDYRPEDVTAEARAIAETPTGRVSEALGPLPARAPRVPRARSLDARKGRHADKVGARRRRAILFGEQEIDLGALSQLVDTSQTEAIARALLLARRHMGEASVPDLLDRVMEAIDRHGLDALDDRRLGNLARFRRQELAGALNRLRTLAIDEVSGARAGRA